jgi:predicted butyrate kinase (DUF1464 family)
MDFRFIDIEILVMMERYRRGILAILCQKPDFVLLSGIFSLLNQLFLNVLKRRISLSTLKPK